MKKTIYYVMAILAFAACNSKIEQPEVNPGVKTYSVTVNGVKTGVTMALADAGSSITATWTAGDEVTVLSGSTPVGTLTAESDGAATRFIGTITGDFNQNDELELRYLSDSYTTQYGTLDGIASSCDYATATVTITDITGGTLTISDAAFVSQQAITKFQMFKPDGTTPLVAKSIIVTADGLTGNKINLDFSMNYKSEFYVAMANTSGVKQEYLFIITANDNTKYYATKKVNLNNGKFYSTTLTALGTISLAYDLSESSDYTYSVYDNGLVYQSVPSVAKSIPLIVADGHSVILFNVNVQSSSKSYSAMTCNAAANITLLGNNTLRGYSGGTNFSSLGSAGIDAQGDPGTKTVTFSGTGNLEAYGGFGAAGIGATALSGSGHVHSNLVFNGTGTITATSKQYGAGIGSGVMYNSSFGSTINNSIGSITINSGTIIATSTAGAGNMTAGAGIGTGCGYGTTSSRQARSTCGTITINGGNITATGGKEGAGIGTGSCASTYSYAICGDIVITGGTINATGGSQAPGIGAARGYNLTYNCTCGDITIGAGITSVTATRGYVNQYVECIGRGWNANTSSVCGDITIDAGLTDSGEPGSGSAVARTLVP